MPTVLLDSSAPYACVSVANYLVANPVLPFSVVYPFIYIRGCHEPCFDLPAPFPPGCDHPRPAHKHCPRAGGRHRKAAPEHDGTHVNPLRNKRRRARANFFWQELIAKCQVRKQMSGNLQYSNKKEMRQRSDPRFIYFRNIFFSLPTSILRNYKDSYLS